MSLLQSNKYNMTRKALFLLLFSITLFVTKCQQEMGFCPACHLVDCFPTFEPGDCPEDTLYQPTMLHGCCPACVKYLDYGETCDLDDVTLLARTEPLPCVDNIRRVKKLRTEHDLPVLNIFRCGPGYVCSDEKKCDIDESSSQCSLDQDSYFDWLEIEGEFNNCTRYDWERSCTPNGVYTRIQSKFSKFTQQKASRQFCVDPNGERIFGSLVIDDENENEMNCRCSRKRWELEQSENERHNDVTLHCQTNGNFEPLQCDQERCWCVDPQDGHVVSRVVHRDLWKYLSCYDNTHQYLRRCESRQYGKAQARHIMKLHGLTWSQIDDFQCDLDGSFAAVNCKSTESRCGCVDRNNNWIGTYYDADTLKDLFKCTCARDKMADDSIGLSCDKRGNYKPIQQFTNPKPGSEFCVDEDGFQFTPRYPISSDGTKCLIPGCVSRDDECFDSTGTPNGLCRNCTVTCSEYY